MGQVNFAIDCETDATVSVIAKLSKLHRKQILPKIVELGAKVMIRDMGKKTEHGILIEQVFGSLITPGELESYKKKYT